MAAGSESGRSMRTASRPAAPWALRARWKRRIRWKTARTHCAPRSGESRSPRARRRWLPCNRPRRVWAASARPVAEPGRPTRHRPPATAAAARTPGRAPDGPCHAACLSAQHHLYPGKQLAKHHGGQRAQQSHQGGCEQGVGQVFGHHATPRPSGIFRFEFLCMAGILRRQLLTFVQRTVNRTRAWGLECLPANVPHRAFWRLPGVKTGWAKRVFRGKMAIRSLSGKNQPVDNYWGALLCTCWEAS